MIRIRRLRLIGASEDYTVDFCDEQGVAQPLSIIAGEISTGKTAVLEFIDFCLGADSHPAYVEVQRQARSAQLEVELSAEIYVIERALFASDRFAWLHRSALADLGEAHETVKIPTDPAGDPNSLNWLLLRHSGLEGVVLKEAPTQAVSEVDPVSFRDVMWLAFLQSDRLVRRHLLHESGAPMKRLKLRQLIEVIFGVHDQQLAVLGDRISSLEAERDAHSAEIAALRTFLAEQEVGERIEVNEELARAEREFETLQERLAGLDTRMRAAADFADAARARYSNIRRSAGRAAARARDRDALLRRLLPLRGQYAEDDRKLIFFAEAKRLFDPLAVRVCPVCLEKLGEEPHIEGGVCSLCHTELSESGEEIDVEAERAAIRIRLRTLSQYIQNVEDQLRADRAEYTDLASQEREAQAALDSDLAERLSPFVAERDAVVRETEIWRGRVRDLKRQLAWLDGVERRRNELERLNARITELRAELRALEEDRPSRDSVVSDLSRRFHRILKDFGFPKLEDPVPPYLDEHYVPHVRGLRYDELGTRGGVTLIALAWQLTIFERAIEQGLPHPGFLMIDSPQTNLKPAAGEQPDEYARPEIVHKLWHHIAEWSAREGDASQMIVVDHIPPGEVADAVVVRFSGDAADPPYGLIANETGRQPRSDSAEYTG